jgi:valyl-tRNA synthetase
LLRSNKLWNAFKFALAYVSEDFTPSADMHLKICGNSAASKRDLYILSRLNSTIKDCNLAISGYLFGAATSALHSFFLYDVCDLYLELLKPVFADQTEDNKGCRQIAQTTLFVVLEYFLRLSHPMMPFVTEELWQRLPNRRLFIDIPSVMIAKYPEADESWFNPTIESNMELVKEVL